MIKFTQEYQHYSENIFLKAQNMTNTQKEGLQEYHPTIIGLYLPVFESLKQIEKVLRLLTIINLILSKFI